MGDDTNKNQEVFQENNAKFMKLTEQLFANNPG